MVNWLTGFVANKMRFWEKPTPEEYAYCVKCRMKNIVINPIRIVMKNGHPALRGHCQACGTKVFRIEKQSANQTL